MSEINAAQRYVWAKKSAIGLMGGRLKEKYKYEVKDITDDGFYVLDVDNGVKNGWTIKDFIEPKIIAE